MARSIFISHSTKDEEIVGYFIDDILIGTLGFHHKEIFCTSAGGMKIKPGDDWREAIKTGISMAQIIFLVITPHYKESEICQNELGAAWVSGRNVIPLIVEPITYKTVGVIQEPMQVEKLTEEDGLDKVKDLIEELFSDSLKKAASDRWTNKKREFLTKIRGYLKKHPFEEPVNRNELEKLRRENQELQKAYESLVEEKIQLQGIVHDLEKEKGVAKVREIKRKHGVGSELDEFEELISQVTKTMSELSSVIRTLVYNSYTGEGLEIDYQTNSASLRKAIANGMIDKELQVNWRNPVMMKIKSALDVVKSFMKNQLSAGSFEELEEKHPSVLIEFSNLEFWERVMNIRMDYE